MTTAPVIGLVPATRVSWATLFAARAPWKVTVIAPGSGPPVTLTSPTPMFGSASSAVRTAAAEAFCGSVVVAWPLNRMEKSALGVPEIVCTSLTSVHGATPGFPCVLTGKPAAETAAGFVEVWSTIRLLMSRG